jgi:hypothetical protein
MFWRSG